MSINPNKPLCSALCCGCGDDISDDNIDYMYSVLPVDTTNVYPEVVEVVVPTGITPSICFNCAALLTLVSNNDDAWSRWKHCDSCGCNTANDEMAFRVTELLIEDIEIHTISLNPDSGIPKEYTLLATEPSSDGVEVTVCLSCMAPVMEDSAEGEIDEDRPLTAIYTYASDRGVWDTSWRTSTSESAC